MKKYYIQIIHVFFMLLFTLGVKAQTYYKVESQFIPAVTVGGNNVVVTPLNGAVAGGNTCGISSSQGFWIGNPSQSGFIFSFTKPASDIRLKLMGISDDERLKITINNSLYTIQTSDISPNPGTCTSPTTYTIVNGELTGDWPSPSTQNAIVDINIGSPIFNIELSGYSTLNPPSTSGYIVEFYFVNDTCYAPFTATATTPCAGGDLELSVDSIPNVTQYDWVKSSTAVSSNRTPTVPNIPASGAGTYFVTATRGNCTYSSSVNVTVNTSPSPVANTTTNNGPLCPGSTLNLSTGTVSGVTYIWDGPNSFTSTQQNPVKNNITALAEGKYYVRTQSATNGCISAPDSTTLTLFYPTAPPVAGGDALVCRGTDIHLTASNVPGATYEWTGPNGYFSTQQNPVRTGVGYADSGDYYVIAKLNGCSSNPGKVHTSVKILTPPPGPTSNSPVCPGTDIVFGANNIPNATYNWFGVNNFTSTSQNPVITNAILQNAGTYSVAANVNGCISDTQTVNVVIAILAATPKAGNNGPVCPGKSLELTANTIPNASYEWTGPNFSSTQQNPVIPNITTGNAGKYYVASIINGCKSLQDSTIVKVEILTPTPDGQSNGPICRGDQLNLTAQDIANATYTWTGPGNFESSLQNPARVSTHTNDSGYYIVTAIVDGCKSLPDTVKVDFKPMPDIVSSSSNTPVCTGDSLVLMANSVMTESGVKYIWRGPGGYNNSPAQRTVRGDVNAAMAGKYYVTAYYDGCYSDSQELEVVVKPKPAFAEISGNQTLRLGETLELSASNIQPGTSYWWSCPDGNDRSGSTISIPDISKAGEGDYYFIVMLDGCQSATKKYITVNDKETFILYPNPNNGSFTIKVTLKKDQKIPIEIINAVGQSIYSDISETENKLMIKTIDLGGSLTNGMYVLRLGVNGETKDLRFLILR